MIINLKTMKIKTFLIIDSSGNLRLTKNSPALRMSEVSISLAVEIPDAVFNKPSLSAKITILDSEIDRNLSAEVQSNVIDAIKESTGMEVKLIIDDKA